MLRPSRHINTADLQKGAVCSTLLDLLTAMWLYANLRKKLKAQMSRIIRTDC